MQKDLKGRSAAAKLESEKTLGTRLTRDVMTVLARILNAAAKLSSFVQSQQGQR